MELSELTAYAGERYDIREQHKWADFPGFSVLCHPRSGQWVALLMRQWDTDSGTEIQRCDLKCGKQALWELEKPYLSSPLRMRGPKWIGVSFDSRTEPEIVFRLLDRAVTEGEPYGCTIVLESAPAPSEAPYRDTPLPFAGSAYQPPKEKLPERLRQMRRLYEYGRESSEERAVNFYRQGKFMEDYEDDIPWQGDFLRYFPTYHDLTTQQLRGYFSWRACVRSGDFRPIPASAAYIYLYELLNGIGAVSPEDSLEKLCAFETGYIDSGLGDKRMRQNLRRWMLEFCVIHGLPPALARQYADPELLGRDDALTSLRSPAERPDEELFSALCYFDGKLLLKSPVLAGNGDRGKHLFCEVWRLAASGYRHREKDLFTLCFGERARRPWHPLGNAVFHWQGRPEDRTYTLDECRHYRCRDGLWQAENYEKLSFDRDRFRGLLHETDRLLRRYLKTGRYLREKPEDAWALPYIEAVIEADRRAALEAAKPKIEIDLSGLDRIREDAVSTRDSLLTEEELREMEEADTPVSVPLPMPGVSLLTDMQASILRALLAGRPPDDILMEHGLMPSIAADAINDALYDEIGDVVLLCEDDELSLVEDYLDDISQILGGTQ